MTKLKPGKSLALAATLTFLPFAVYAQQANTTTGLSSQSSMSSSNSQMNASSSRPYARQEAAHMVPASVMLLESIDARKMEPGADFKARLSSKVHLANGMELPAGTIFEGTLASDDMNVQGNSKVALRFTRAEMKDGTSIPIKATIIAVYTPANQFAGPDNGIAPTPPPNSWNDGTLQVDQIGVASGVDLHSKISSRNSGVLVTTKKDDVKLAKGTAFDLAVAEGQGSQQASSAGPGGSGPVTQ
jgi:hypothetical protein